MVARTQVALQEASAEQVENSGNPEQRVAFKYNTVAPDNVYTRPDGTLKYDWDGNDDPNNPFNWPKSTKWKLTIAVLIVSVNFGLPAGAYGSGNADMEKLFHIDQTNFPWLYFATTSWNIGAAFFPLLFVPLTESSGRMPGYFGAYIIFVIFLLPCALAQNFATMVVCRLFGGGASSVAINIVGGTISDIWQGAKDRSLPMALFGFTSVIGIALGPFVGAAITTHLSFRWIYWIQMIYNGALLPIFYFILTETRGDIILARRAKAHREKTGEEVYADSELIKDSIWTKLSVSFKRPVKMLCTEWVVASQTLWVAFAWGILFLFTSSVTQTFSTNYGFSTWKCTLIQLAISVGAFIATCINPLQDRAYLRSASRSKDGKPVPEARLYSALPGSLIFTVGLFWYGWTSFPHVHWILPTIGIALVGIGIYSIYLGVVNYLTDSYERYAGSALSAASLGRNSFGAFLPLASQNLYKNLNFRWASTLLGFIGLVLTAAPIVLVWKGEEIRKRSPFMKEATFSTEEADERAELTGQEKPSGGLPAQKAEGLLGESIDSEHTSESRSPA